MKPKDCKLLLAGSFAGMTAPFAVHPSDNKRARQMFHAAFNVGVSLNDIESDARTFLMSQACSEGFINAQIQRIRQYPHNPAKKLKAKRAWLVTKEDSHGMQEVVAILSYRKSSETVADFVEQLHIATMYTEAEKLVYAKCPKDNPYRAEYDRVNGIQWGGRMTCGHNRFLVARVAGNLTVVQEESGEAHLVWEEIERPGDLAQQMY
jgi:hypothetical protein